MGKLCYFYYTDFKKDAHKEVLVVQGPFDKILNRKVRILNYAQNKTSKPWKRLKKKNKSPKENTETMKCPWVCNYSAFSCVQVFVCFARLRIKERSQGLGHAT